MIEICVDSVDSALSAQAGGADRLELCSALVVGGLSPTPELLETLRQRGVTLPVRAMVRPRFGDFLYSEAEKDQMLLEARGWAERGASGVVVGALTREGGLDEEFLSSVIAASPGIGHTLHRAFDVAADPFAALETAIRLGFDTILTSGQRASAREGAALIAALRERAAGRVTILVGADVTAEVIPELKRTTGCAAYHLSAKRLCASEMKFRREGVPMGLPGFDEYSLWLTDEGKVRAAKAAEGR